MADARATLRRSLGGGADRDNDRDTDLDAVLEPMTDDEAALVAELLVTAERTERDALNASIDTTLRHLPRLVRGPARKILFG